MAAGGAYAAGPCGDDRERPDGMGQQSDPEAARVHDGDQMCGRPCAQGGRLPAACPAIVRRPAGLSHRTRGPSHGLYGFPAGLRTSRGHGAVTTQWDSDRGRAAWRGRACEAERPMSIGCVYVLVAPRLAKVRIKVRQRQGQIGMRTSLGLGSLRSVQDDLKDATRKSMLAPGNRVRNA